VVYIIVTILGWLGIITYLIVFLSAQKLINKGESALLHLLICFVFVFLTPIPIYLYSTIGNEYFLVSTIFGYIFFILIITTMALQVGHLAYRNKQKNTDIWEERDSWMINGMLGDIYESIVGVIFHLWIILLALGFFQEGIYSMGVIMALFSWLLIRSLLILLKLVLKEPISFLNRVKLSPILTNLETFLLFLIIIIWISL
jgi:hypothetical protein